MDEIPAISFIRIGNSLIDENCYLDNDDMLRIWQHNITNINYNNSSRIIKKQASSVYHTLIQKKYQELKNKKI